MAKKALRYNDGKSDKFWNIELQGTSHTVNYGKAGTSGQTKTKEFSTEDEARTSFDKLIAKKLKKGYADTDPGASEKATVAAEVAAPDEVTVTEEATEPTPPAPNPFDGKPRRRFEQEDKFWVIDRDGAQYTITEGKTKSKTLKDEAAATKSFEKEIAKKLDKGYREVAPLLPPAEQAEERVRVEELNRSFATLASALEHADAGMTLTLNAGFYAESIEISKSVTIKTRGRCVLEYDSGVPLTITAEAADIRGLRIRGRYRSKTKYYKKDHEPLVVISSGRSVFTDCHIGGAGLDEKRLGVRITGEGTAPSLKGCRINDMYIGVQFTESAGGRVEGCEIDHCKIGIDVPEGCEASISGCKISENSDGIQAHGGVIEDCQIYSNGKEGDSGHGTVWSGSQISLIDTVCRTSRISGCGNQIRGNTLLEDCEFEGGPAIALTVGEQGEVTSGVSTIKGCTFRGGTSWHVAILKHFSVLCEGSKFLESGKTAVGVHGILRIRDCLFDGNKWGLCGYNRFARVSAENCEFVNSKEVGVALYGCHGYFWNSRFQDGVAGVTLTGRTDPNNKATHDPGFLTMDNCQVLSNDAIGIEIKEGDFLARHCIVQGNEKALVGAGRAIACTLSDNQNAHEGEWTLEGCDPKEHEFLPDEKRRPSQLELLPLEGRNRPGAELDYLLARGLNLKSLNVTGGWLRGMAAENTDLSDCVFKDADLTGAHFEKVKLVGSNFDGSNCAGCKLWVSLDGTSFRGADLTGARIEDHIPWNKVSDDFRPLDFSGAILNGARVRAIFTNGKLVQSQGCEAQLSGSFRGCDFSGGNFEKATLEGVYTKANFSGAVLREAKLTSVNMTEADFSNCDLRDANLNRVNLSGAKLDGAQLEGAVFQNCELTGISFDGDPPEALRAAVEAARAAEKERLAAEEAQRKLEQDRSHWIPLTSNMKQCIDDYGCGEEDYLWGNNILANDALRGPSGILGRPGEVEGEPDAAVLDEVRALAEKAGVLAKGLCGCFGCEAGDEMEPFFVAPHSDWSCTALDKAGVSSLFGSALYPDAPFKLQAIDLEASWWSSAQEMDEDGLSEEHEAQWKTLIDWFQSTFPETTFVNFPHFSHDMRGGCCYPQLWLGRVESGGVAGLFWKAVWT
jgi:uncharacterized protein YjbI with pentapeptide repeats/predicted DNA-binding WGR domain protein